MKKSFALFGAVCGLVMAGSIANAATVVDVGTYPAGADSHYFFITSGTPTGTNIHATFGATPSGGTAFDYLFEFRVAYNGTGSGSLTDSFVTSPDVTVTQVIINGVSYAPTNVPSGQTLNVGGVALTALALDTIEVIGTDTAVGAPFTGTIAYVASVPEPATWATFLLGFGFMGLALRRKLSTSLETA